MNSNDNPLVSIIINCFNGSEYIENAIESILKQTYINFELIIWDNQSTDDSKNIISKFIDSRIRYFCADSHTNLYTARNKAVEKSRGDFITFLDCDDWWEETKIEKQIEKFKTGDFAIVYANQRLIFDKKTRFGKHVDIFVCKFLSRNHINKKILLRKGINLEGNILRDIIEDYKVGIATVMIRKELFDKFDDRFHIIGDFEFVIRTASKYSIGYIDEILAYYRVHGFNESFRMRKLQISELKMWHKETEKNEVISKLNSFKKFKYKIRYLEAMDNVGDKDYKKVIKTIMEIPFSLWKLKLRLLIILLSPSIVVKIFRT
tara:strand:+ start:4856 stop:5812 length:957 start_codon:yes stop_codon:yes gene_type:complete